MTTLTLTPVSAGSLYLQTPYPLTALRVYNVKDYGAVCDNATDDLAKIHLARDAAQAAGGGIVLIPGLAGISGPVDLSATTNVHLCGSSDGLLVSYPSACGLKALAGFSATAPLVKISSGTGNIDAQVVIRDLYLNGNSLAQDGVYTFDASGVYCRRVVVTGVTRDGFHFDGTSVSTSSNQECVDCYSNGATNAGYYLKAQYVKLVRAIADGGAYGAYVAGSNALVTEGHYEGSSNTCVYVTAAGNCRISGNQIVTSVASANGITVTGASSEATKLIGNSLAGRSSVGTSGVGITLAAPGCVAVGNTISGYDTAISDTGGGQVISGNKSEIATTTGISFNHSGTISSVTGNFVSDAATSVAITSGTAQGANNYFSGTVASQLRQTGYEFAYNTATSNTNITATTEATANTIVTASAVTFDGATDVYVEFEAPLMSPAATVNQDITLVLYDGSSSIGKIANITNPATASMGAPVFRSRKLTPSAAAHTYSIRGYVSSGTGVVYGGAGGVGAFTPAILRITRA